MEDVPDNYENYMTYHGSWDNYSPFGDNDPWDDDSLDNPPDSSPDFE